MLILIILIYVSLSLIFVSCLAFIRPDPPTLKAPPTTFWEDLDQVRVTLIVGVLSLLLFPVILSLEGDGNFEAMFSFFTLSSLPENLALLPLQLVTSNFVQPNFVHLWYDVMLLGTLSIYERRVGSTRFVTVLAIGLIFSKLPLIIFNEPVISSGMSAGIVALAVGFLVDIPRYKDLSWMEWFFYIFVLIAFAILSSLADETARFDIRGKFDLLPDSLAAIFGAVGALIYCCLSRLDEPKTIGSAR